MLLADRRLLATAYQAAMAAFAVAAIALLPVEASWAHAANLAIWAVFTVDYAVRLWLADNRRQFVRENVVGLIAILPLDFLRAARLLRLVRLTRSLSVIWRVSAQARAILATNGLAWVLAVAGATVFIAAGAVLFVEPEIGTFGDALWWSVVTATTVGYGDISPSSGLGRGIAVVLMLVGIGVIGMVTGTVATYFTQPRRSSNPLVSAVAAQLQRWDELSPDERRGTARALAALAEDA
jgi:voltage-gated potassium channel